MISTPKSATGADPSTLMPRRTKTAVIVIDDDPGFTSLVRRQLESSGDYWVRTETNSLNALRSIRDYRPDVILLDLMMPGIDGGEILRQLQADFRLRDIPVIIVTALVSEGETSPEAVAETEGRTVLGKPVDRERLIQVIEQTMLGVI